VTSARDRRVLLLITHRTRDLEGHALLAYHLEESHGIEAHVCNIRDFEERLLEVAPDLVVLDFLGWDVKAAHARLARRLGVRVAVLPIAALYETHDEHLRAAGSRTGANRDTDLFLAWGDYTRRIVVEGGIFRPEQVLVTGSPRFDLYHPAYLALGEDAETFRRRLELREGAPRIVWSTNTPSFARDRARTIREWIRDNHLTAEEASERLLEEERQFTQHAALVGELARRHPDWDFVIKIHPIESIEPYHPLAAAAPNVRLTKAGPIRDFLLHADALIQRGCTTANEAWMLGKPVLELAVKGSRVGWAPSEFLQGNLLVDGVDEADAALEAIVRGDGVAPALREAREAYLSDHYGRLDGRAAERCAARIAALIVAPARRDEESARTRNAAAEMRRQKALAQARRPAAWIKRALGLPEDLRLRFWKRRSEDLHGVAEREVDDAMVDELKARFARIAPIRPGAVAVRN
jgi:surface carbohydrate biosynthesis protein